MWVLTKLLNNANIFYMSKKNRKDERLKLEIDEQNNFIESLRHMLDEAKQFEDYMLMDLIDEELENYFVSPNLFAKLDVENRLFILNFSDYYTMLEDDEKEIVIQSIISSDIMFCDNLIDFVLDYYSNGLLEASQLYQLLIKMQHIATRDEFEKLDKLRKSIRSDLPFCDYEDVDLYVKSIKLIGEIKMEVFGKLGFQIVEGGLSQN